MTDNTTTGAKPATTAAFEEGVMMGAALEEFHETVETALHSLGFSVDDFPEPYAELLAKITGAVIELREKLDESVDFIEDGETPTGEPDFI